MLVNVANVSLAEHGAAELAVALSDGIKAGDMKAAVDEAVELEGASEAAVEEIKAASEA